MSASAVRPARSGSGASHPSGASSNDDALGAESVSPEIAARSLTGFTGNRRVPPPVNEAIKSYAPGSPERAELKIGRRCAGAMAEGRALVPVHRALYGTLAGYGSPPPRLPV